MNEHVRPHLMVFTCLIHHVQYMQPLAFFVQQRFFLLFLVVQDLLLVYFDVNLLQNALLFEKDVSNTP